MELVVSLVIETENGEDLVVLLCVNDLLMSNRTSLLSLHLHVGSGSHETLGSKLGDSRLSKDASSNRSRLQSEHFKQILRKKQSKEKDEYRGKYTLLAGKVHSIYSLYSYLQELE